MFGARGASRPAHTRVTRIKVLILGSGVIGTTAAYYLARAGFEVEVIDRQPAPAMETSYANAGEVSPGYSAPWAGPGVPLKAIKWLLMRHRPAKEVTLAQGSPPLRDKLECYRVAKVRASLGCPEVASRYGDRARSRVPTVCARNALGGSALGPEHRA